MVSKNQTEAEEKFTTLQQGSLLLLGSFAFFLSVCLLNTRRQKCQVLIPESNWGNNLFPKVPKIIQGCWVFNFEAIL